ncbi:hypothetical protein EVAR_59649_1 [Eumeta japonica]|uniref:Uncharacterized protein n=1 Tax=Eumeta variegata TaxID=151549 RepID=A0A4C1YID7_EUMVA|nr:hypothetical protein EVAR_59649_1 [Eumeta japonica]
MAVPGRGEKLRAAEACNRISDRVNMAKSTSQFYYCFGGWPPPTIATYPTRLVTVRQIVLHNSHNRKKSFHKQGHVCMKLRGMPSLFACTELAHVGTYGRIPARYLWLLHENDKSGVNKRIHNRRDVDEFTSYRIQTVATSSCAIRNFGTFIKSAIKTLNQNGERKRARRMVLLETRSDRAGAGAGIHRFASSPPLLAHSNDRNEIIKIFWEPINHAWADRVRGAGAPTHCPTTAPDAQTEGGGDVVAITIRSDAVAPFRRRPRNHNLITDRVVCEGRSSPLRPPTARPLSGEAERVGAEHFRSRDVDRCNGLAFQNRFRLQVVQ